MAVVYRCVGILTVDVVVFFRSSGFFHSQDSFSLTFLPRLWETSSGVAAVGVFAAEARRELWPRPSRLSLIYVVHVYCCSVIGQHSNNWNLIGRFLHRCSLLLGFTTLLNILGHQRHFRHRAWKFCSETLILAWGSFMCRKSTTQDPWLYFPSKGSHTQEF